MTNKHRFDESKFRIKPDQKVDLSKISTKAGKELNDKTLAAEALAADVSALQGQQELIFASKSQSMLIIIQGMDTAGKDGVIRHVMGAFNPQGCRVYGFGPPNATELKHHFLWRAGPCLPEKGSISLFNRSYYEEVLVVRVHPKFLSPQLIPGVDIDKPKSLEKLWQRRFKEIRGYERALVGNGTTIMKFYLHLSPQEQAERLLERLKDPAKNWKFNPRDLEERKLWKQYQHAYEECLQHTSTDEAPWYVIPADNKWYARAAIADILTAKVEQLKLKFPEVDQQQKTQFAQFIKDLEGQLK